MQGKRLFEPRVPRIRFQARRRCAVRAIDFLRQLVHASTWQRAILRIKHSVAVIQTMWREALVVRVEQHRLYMQQLLLCEGKVLRSNQRQRMCAFLLHRGPTALHGAIAVGMHAAHKQG